MTAYYVQPEPSASGGEAYWLEGYAVGDAKFAAAQSDGTSTTLIASTRVQLAGVQSDGTSSSLFGGNRVVAGALVQEPVTATVTGVTRVRQGSIRADGTSATLIGGNRVRSIGVLSEGSATVLSGANATYDAFALTRDLYVEGGYWNTGYTEYSAPKTKVIVQAEIVKRTGASALASSSTLAASNRIRTQVGVLSDANGIFIINANATLNFAAVSEAVGEAFAALTEKWLEQAEDQDVWTDKAEDTDAWTDVVEASGTWTSVSEDTDIWTDVSEDTDTWTDLSPLT